MNYTIKFHPEAEREYLEAYQWYEEHQSGLGKRFELAVEKQIKLIADYPEHYAEKKYKCRESKTETFPYLIVYKYYPAKQLIWIISIFHTSRKPSKKNRK